MGTQSWYHDAKRSTFTSNGGTGSKASQGRLPFTLQHWLILTAAPSEAGPGHTER